MIPPLRHSILVVSACFAVVGFFACSPESPRARGELTLAFTTDLSPGKDLDAIRVRVASGGGATKLDREYRVGTGANDVKLPATLVLVGDDDGATRVVIDVFGLRAGSVRTAHHVVTDVPASGNALLYVPIQWLCDGMVREEDGAYTSSCEGSESTCVAGACESADTDASALPDFSAASVFGGAPEPDHPDGVCFSVESCFQDGFRVDPNGECVVEVDARSSDDVNFALVTEPGHDGVCSGLRCYVVLDLHDQFGFRELDAGDDGMRRFALPDAACARLDDGRAVAVFATTSCDVKTPAIPSCGRWSSVGDAAPEPPDDCPGFRPGTELGALVDDPLANRYLEAVAEMKTASEERRTRIAESCLALSLALDGPEIELGNPPTDEQLEEVCTAALDRYETQSAQPHFAIGPTHCSAAVDAQIACEADCQAAAGTDVVARCPRPAGECAGVCTGDCHAAPSAPARCDGQCLGVCVGDCSDECLGTWASGGEACGGGCIGSCTGSCAGTCSEVVDGECGGICLATTDSGPACNDWSREPGCVTALTPDGSDRVCSALCTSRATLEPICTIGGSQNDGSFVAVASAAALAHQELPKIVLLLVGARTLADLAVELESVALEASSAPCVESAGLVAAETLATLETAHAAADAIVSASRP